MLNPAILRRRRWGGDPYAVGGVSPLTVADFQGGTYTGAVSSLGDFTFSRASSATYVDESGDLQSASSNVIRIDYRNNVAALLYEPTSATNLCAESNTFTTTWGTSGPPTLTQDQVGPDGQANSAWTITDDNAGSAEYIVYSYTVAADTSYVLSIFIEKDAAPATYPGFGMINVGAGSPLFIIDPSDGSLAAFSSGSADNTFVDDLGGFLRVSAAFTSGASPGASAIRFYPAVSTNGSTSDLSATGSSVVYGLDLVAGSAPSSHIPTSGSTATRAAESITFSLDAGTYDVRVVTDDGTTDLTSVVHGGGAYWPSQATGRVSRVIVYPEGALA